MRLTQIHYNEWIGVLATYDHETEANNCKRFSFISGSPQFEYENYRFIYASWIVGKCWQVIIQIVCQYDILGPKAEEQKHVLAINFGWSLVMEWTINETRLNVGTCATRSRCDCLHVMQLFRFHMKYQCTECIACTLYSTVNVGNVIFLTSNCHCTHKWNP